MSGMRYIWRAPGHTRAGREGGHVMHIAAFDRTGELTMRSLCGREPCGGFDRTINAPFALGRRVCRECQKRLGTS